MTRCPLRCEGGRALRKEQTRQKRIELRALQSCRDGPTPLLQEELEMEELEETTPRPYAPDWEPGDRLFLMRLLPELTQTDLRAMATTSQHLTEGARRSKET